MADEDKQVKGKLLAELKQRAEKVKEMGGSERVEAQKKKGKLTARQRIDILLDKGTFREIGMFAKSRGAVAEVPTDAVITGYGKINGRRVYLYSQDFTITGGPFS